MDGVPRDTEEKRAGLPHPQSPDSQVLPLTEMPNGRDRPTPVLPPGLVWGTSIAKSVSQIYISPMETLLHASGERRSASDFIIPALDVETVDQAKRLLDELSPVCDRFKVGKHFILDPRWSQFLHEEFSGTSTRTLFLDLKDFETGESSRLFSRQVCNFGVEFYTVHAFRNTMKVAVAERRLGTSILAVPLLTSMGPDDLKEFYNWDVDDDGSIEQFFLDRAEMALNCGVDGLICSAQEVGLLRRSFDSEFWIVVPGFHEDHARSGTPAQAVKDGADYVVIGRRIRQAKEPRAAFEVIAEEIEKIL